MLCIGNIHQKERLTIKAIDNTKEKSLPNMLGI